MLEPALRERIAARVGRGKLDLTMRLRDPEGGDALQLDPATVGQLSQLARELHGRFPMLRVELTDLLQFPGLLAGRGTEQSGLRVHHRHRRQPHLRGTRCRIGRRRQRQCAGNR